MNINKAKIQIETMFNQSPYSKNNDMKLKTRLMNLPSRLGIDTSG